MVEWPHYRHEDFQAAPLPTYPPSIALTFQGLRKPVSNSVMAGLKHQLVMFKGKLGIWDRRLSPFMAKLAFALHERATMLVRNFDKLTPDQQELAAAAILHLVREQDGIDDQRPIVGFDDDTKVMNHVLEEIGMGAHIIEHPDA